MDYFRACSDRNAFTPSAAVLCALILGSAALGMAGCDDAGTTTNGQGGDAGIGGSGGDAGAAGNGGDAGAAGNGGSAGSGGS
ncbi:MAG TPA: hypothetical protein PK156_06645, partial [Polyangium sp.]|nr:hypothetical protein [Polyangium sp.]